MVALDCTGPTELAVRMGWGPNTPRKVTRWLESETKPDYTSTMEMLEATGWLNMSADAQTDAASPRDPLERIAEGVTTILGQQEKILQRLPAKKRVQQRQPAKAQPKRRA